MAVFTVSYRCNNCGGIQTSSSRIDTVKAVCTHCKTGGGLRESDVQLNPLMQHGIDLNSIPRKPLVPRHEDE